jgi:alkylation response protein AidB-like acyl-CoA dehydrogenase
MVTSMIDEMRLAVRKLAELEIPRYQNEQYYGTLPRPLFNSCAEIGLAGLSIPEEFGGLEASPRLSAAVMEELAAVDLGPAIFVSVHSMVSSIVNRFGSPEQRARLLPLMASGKVLGAFGLTEPSAGSDAGALKTSVTIKGTSYILNGQKCYISSAGWADLYVVFARHSDGAAAGKISAFLVEPASIKSGFEISKPEKKMGCELSPIASLFFENLEIPLAQRIGPEGEGYKIALSGLAGGRISIAACANGLSRTAIDCAVKHLKEREQFGKPLFEFQGLQFMLADMRMKFEAAKLLTAEAARILEESPDSRENRLYPSMAKCYATDAAMSITTDAVQLLGGAGYLREYTVERLMRDAKMLQIVEGANQIQRTLIAREMAR